MLVKSRIPELITAKFKGNPVNLLRVQEATGLNYVTVSRWYKGQVDRVEFKTLAIWCKYLDCQVGDILVYDPEASEKK